MPSSSWILTALLLAAAAGAAPTGELLRESLALLSAGDVAGARAKAAAAAAAAPGDPRVAEVLGRAELAALNFAAAEAAATRALAAGENPARLVLRSAARAGRRDFRGALEDAERAVLLSPNSGPARFRLASAKEGLGRPVQDVLADYRRAAELDVTLVEPAAEAAERLRALAATPTGARLGPILIMLAVSAVFGWVWGMASKAAGPETAPPPVPLPQTGRLSASAALRTLAEAAAADFRDTRELAEWIYERLTGR
ncbi:MAG: hypothetical protein HYZ74_06735, partial [Elusimicrobia bacterium]|nr:hypothetical protein [Elusimicrobiota bacterium]